jgi:hypothetical protein
VEIWKNSPMARHDKGKILVRETWTRKYAAQILAGRAKLRKEGAR